MKKITTKDIADDLISIAQEKQKTALTQSVEGNIELARKALDEGNFPIALYYLDRAIELSPDNLRLIKERIKVYIVLKDYKEVKDQLEYLLNISKDKHEDVYSDAQTVIKIVDIKIDQQKLLDAFPIYC